tara:strand:+ start:208 stop:735 length:528 start_codon:yes stop_codon:yes gene_type:complete
MMERLLVSQLKDIPQFNDRIASCAKQAIEFVLDPIYTSRKSIEELSKTEKTIIGTKYEQVLTTEFNFDEDSILDCQLNSIPFDIKFSCRGRWMIPQECYKIQGLCLCTELNDDTLSVGVIKTSPENLTKGQNQDKKLTISKKGRANMNWLIQNKKIEIKPSALRMFWHFMKRKLC